MTVDKFKFIPEEVEKFINSLYNLINEYKKEINNLELLVKEIDSSNSWKDALVKTEFINNCNSYIKMYNGLIDACFSRIEFLKNKSKQAIDIENSYKRG